MSNAVPADTALMIPGADGSGAASSAQTATPIDGSSANDNISASELPPGVMRLVDAIALAVAAGVRAGARSLGSAIGDDPTASTSEPDREVMEADEVATFLGLDRKTVYDYAARGAIPCRRLGKRLLFSRRALVVWLAGTCSNGSSNGDSK